MAPHEIIMLTHTTRSMRDGGRVPRLPLLRHETSLDSTRWLSDALTTFGTSVASFLPGHFAAYARIQSSIHVRRVSVRRPWHMARAGHSLRPRDW